MYFLNQIFFSKYGNTKNEISINKRMQTSVIIEARTSLRRSKMHEEYYRTTLNNYSDVIHFEMSQ